MPVKRFYGQGTDICNGDISFRLRMTVRAVSFPSGHVQVTLELGLEYVRLIVDKL